jgi:glutathione S-transferase
MRNVLFARDDVTMKTYFEQMEEVFATLEDLINKCSEGKVFFGGDKIGFVDIAFGCLLGWLRILEKMVGKNLFDEAITPSLVKWAEYFVADPAVKGILPETDKLMEHAKSLLQKQVAADPAVKGILPK